MSRVRGGDVRTVFLFVTFPEGRIITAGGGGGDIFTSGGSGGPETRQEDCIQYLTGEPEDRLLTTDQTGRHDIIQEEKLIKKTSDQTG
jgi:hypothetical protein